MVSRRFEQIDDDGPCWYQFLPVSLVLHLIIFGLCSICIPKTAEWQAFAVRDFEERHMVPFREAVVDWSDMPEEFQMESAVSPDENPFEETPIEVVQPDIDLQTQDGPKDELKDIKIAEIPSKIPDEKPLSASDVTTDYHEQDENLSETTQKTDLSFHHENVESADSNPVGKNSDKDAWKNDSSASHKTSDGSSERGQKVFQVDEQIIWKQYAKQLSEHFKKHRHYPAMARKRRLTGVVWLIVEVRRDGSLISVEIAESSGIPILDEAAVSSAKKSVPVPPFPQNTDAQTKKLRIPYSFKLK